MEFHWSNLESQKPCAHFASTWSYSFREFKPVNALPYIPALYFHIKLPFIELYMVFISKQLENKIFSPSEIISQSYSEPLKWPCKMDYLFIQLLVLFIHI